MIARPSAVVRNGVAVTVSKVLPVVNRGPKRSAEPFDSPQVLRPHSRRGRYACTHFTVTIPGLSGGFRFLQAGGFIGQPGTRASDPIGVRYVAGPRDTAVAHIATAATAPGYRAAYSVGDDCTFRPDGGDWRWGDELHITGEFPHYELRIRAGELTADLEITCTDVATGIADTPIYKHVSLLSTYHGVLSLRGREHEATGLCTLDHMLTAGTASFASRLMPDMLRFPMDFVTHHVVNLDSETQLLLMKVQVQDHPIATSAFLRTISGRTEIVADDIEFEVTEFSDREITGADGHRTRVPHAFRWRTGPDAPFAIDLVGAVDTEFVPGLGAGYGAGFHVSGTVDGQRIRHSNAHLEYTDRST